MTKSELEYYLEISVWLKNYLKNKNRGAKVFVDDVHSINLSDFIIKKGLSQYFPEGITYKIKIDLVGGCHQEKQMQIDTGRS